MVVGTAAILEARFSDDGRGAVAVAVSEGTTEDPTGALISLVVGTTFDDPGMGIVSATFSAIGVVSAAFCTAVTGQMVVYSAIVSVVTWPFFAGQSVTSGAQEVIV